MDRETDSARFKTCLLACSEVYGKPVSKAVFGIWWESLKGYEIAAVEAAFQRHLTSPDAGQFMPKPADVVRMLVGTSLDAAMIAWAKVDRAVRAVGPYPSVTFDDPIVQRVVLDMGGWVHLCGKKDDEWPFVGNEFRTRYQGYRTRNEKPEYPARLTGLTEADHSRRGLPYTDAVLIGDKDRAGLVNAMGANAVALGVQRLVLPSLP